MYFITISEMIGTNGEKVAKQVAQELDYRFFGEEELMKSAADKGFLKDFKRLDEKGPAFFDTYFSEWPKISLDRVQSVIYEVAKDGNAVFVGRGSQLLLRSFDCALHVLLTGSKGKRIERVTDEKMVGREVAEKIIERSDHDKKNFLRFAFDEDWLNPHLYDIVLNTDKLSLDSAARMIIDAARSEGIKACGIDSVKLLAQQALQRKVESAFLEKGLMKPHLFFNVDDPETVRIYGFVDSSDEKEQIGSVLRKISGVKKVANDLAIRKGAMGGI